MGHYLRAIHLYRTREFQTVVRIRSCENWCVDDGFLCLFNLLTEKTYILTYRSSREVAYGRGTQHQYRSGDARQAGGIAGRQPSTNTNSDKPTVSPSTIARTLDGMLMTRKLADDVPAIRPEYSICVYSTRSGSCSTELSATACSSTKLAATHGRGALLEEPLAVSRRDAWYTHNADAAT